ERLGPSEYAWNDNVPAGEVAIPGKTKVAERLGLVAAFAFGARSPSKDLCGTMIRDILACAAGFKPRVLFWFFCVAMAIQSAASLAATKENVDESRVPAYTLPDPLVAVDGARASTAAEWNSKRRPELLKIFETEIYGRAPQQKADLTFHVD